MFITTLPLNKEWIITSDFGPRWGEFHNGIDIVYSERLPLGEPIFAMETGVVSNGVDDNGGLYQILRVSDGYWLYVHASEFVRSGNVVQGDVIELAGKSGNASGVHIHLAFYSYAAGAFIDPKSRIDYLNSVNKAKVEEIIRQLEILNKAVASKEVKVEDFRKTYLPIEFKNGNVEMFTDAEGFIFTRFKGKDKAATKWMRNGQTCSDIISEVLGEELIQYCSGTDNEIWYRETQNGLFPNDWKKL